MGRSPGCSGQSCVGVARASTQPGWGDRVPLATDENTGTEELGVDQCSIYLRPFRLVSRIAQAAGRLGPTDAARGGLTPGPEPNPAQGAAGWTWPPRARTGHGLRRRPRLQGRRAGHHRRLHVERLSGQVPTFSNLPVYRPAGVSLSPLAWTYAADEIHRYVSGSLFRRYRPHSPAHAPFADSGEKRCRFRHFEKFRQRQAVSAAHRGIQWSRP